MVNLFGDAINHNKKAAFIPNEKLPDEKSGPKTSTSEEKGTYIHLTNSKMRQ